VILGRDVALADTAAAGMPVVIGSDLARAMWGDANPLGRSIASPPLPDMDQDSLRMTVVGVYDATFRLPGMAWGGGPVSGSLSEGYLRVYTAHGKQWLKDKLLVRTRAPAEPFVTELQRFVRDAAPALPLTGARTLARIDEEEYQITLRVAALAGVGGGLAMLLASLGLYGVVSLAVRQRTREIGIRIAVGAHPMQVARMFLRSGVRVSLVALAIGLPLSVAVLKIAISQGQVIAPGVNPYLIGAVIAAMLVGVAAVATWLPARRAAEVDPATTLRAD
jgi:putative ABC transport system permease protein